MLKKASYNNKRLESDILRILNNIFYFELHNPHLKNVSASHVILSNNKRSVKVYLQVFNNGHYVLKHFNQIKKHLRYKLSSQLHLNRVPELFFYADESIIQSEKITRLLNEKNL